MKTAYAGARYVNHDALFVICHWPDSIEFKVLIFKKKMFPDFLDHLISEQDKQQHYQELGLFLGYALFFNFSPPNLKVSSGKQSNYFIHRLCALA